MLFSCQDEVSSLGPCPRVVGSIYLGPRCGHGDSSSTYWYLPSRRLYWLIQQRRSGHRLWIGIRLWGRKVLPSSLEALLGSANAGSSGPPKIVTGVDSSYGSYSLQGCYDASAGGYTITAATSSSTSMSLEYCASYCKGSPYFAIENGRIVPNQALVLYAC